jgi:hypothetical protein
MVVPALGLRRWLQRADRRQLNAAVTALLVAGGGALLLWPGLNGLMAASLLHGVAWSLAWAAPMLRREVGAVAATRPLGRQGRVTLGQAGLTAAAVLALGIAIELAGPQPLVAVHAALAMMAVAGLLISAVRHHPGTVTTKGAPS